MVCAIDFANLEVQNNETLDSVINKLKELKGLNKPGINVFDGDDVDTLYISGPPVLE